MPETDIKDIGFSITENIRFSEFEGIRFLAEAEFRTDILFLVIYASGLTDDVCRVQFALSPHDAKLISPNIGIDYYCFYITEHVFSKLFDCSEKYDFKEMRKENRDFVKFMSKVADKLKETIDEIDSPTVKNNN